MFVAAESRYEILVEAVLFVWMGTQLRRSVEASITQFEVAGLRRFNRKPPLVNPH